MAIALDTVPVPVSAEPRIRRIGLDAIGASLRDGWEDFRAIPTQLVFIGLIYPVLGFAAARMATGDLLPLLFPLVAGLSLMGPVLAMGTYAISRRRETGLPVSWLNAFDPFRDPAFPGIVAMAFGLLVVFGLWLMAARAIYFGTIGPVVPDGMGALMALLHTPRGHALIVIGNLVGFLFAVVVLAGSTLSFPMVLDRACSPLLAIRTSIRGVARNPLAMAAWGLVVAVVLALGCIPLFVGLAVAMPVLGHATWHLYRRVVD